MQVRNERQTRKELLKLQYPYLADTIAVHTIVDAGNILYLCGILLKESANLKDAHQFILLKNLQLQTKR